MAGFIARKRLHMGDGLFREYGEPVPEAEHWLNRTAAVRCGEIERASDHDYAEACARWEARKRADAEKAQAEALAALASLPSVVVEPAAEDAPQPIASPDAEVSIHVEPRAEPEPEPEPEQDASADLRSTPEMPTTDELGAALDAVRWPEPERAAILDANTRRSPVEVDGIDPEALRHGGGKRARRRG